jgi:hypothetical protein
MAGDPMRLRSRGEAHCYVAVAKADGTVTAHERGRAPYHARRGQAGLDVMRANATLAETVGRDVASILQDPAYANWDAERHVKEGLERLREAAAAGAPAIETTADKIEAEIRELAYLDGYDLQESRFVQSLLDRLRALG